jgi:alkylhydroperoxidase family enzyme
MAIKPPTKAEAAYMDAVAEIGCIACYVMDIMDRAAQ